MLARKTLVSPAGFRYTYVFRNKSLFSIFNSEPGLMPLSKRSLSAVGLLVGIATAAAAQTPPPHDIVI